MRMGTIMRRQSLSTISSKSEIVNAPRLIIFKLFVCLFSFFCSFSFSSSTNDAKYILLCLCFITEPEATLYSGFFSFVWLSVSQNRKRWVFNLGSIVAAMRNSFS